jgi:hypothetical protein
VTRWTNPEGGVVPWDQFHHAHALCFAWHWEMNYFDMVRRADVWMEVES